MQSSDGILAVESSDGDPAVPERLPSRTPSGAPAVDDMEKVKVHAKLLAEMIPPLSSPAGWVPLTKLTEDPEKKHRAIDLDTDPLYKKNALWPEIRLAKVGPQQASKRWFHFDYKEAPYLLTHTLYEKITEITKGETP
jgi:hypothetical protein